ncbi:MaoC family dehydratase [Sanguibacter antarcticus]|uniref:Acyl dehydratase n=1 Tax=Sanguibacter antarcticus TaxID=372484 RepID=A0A2A9E5H3_9MICO|nr:MaoC family dehydratase [Sanguibacter antarcticus]PFG34093.1 acyl dehydratase [Sanguibacter antarcticus]
MSAPVGRPDVTSLAVGDVIGTRTIPVDRARLVRYAGASGDFNPIHWNDGVASDVGLPGVIAHGMFTMGAAVTLVAEWAADPGAIVDYQTRFSRPVPVPARGETQIEVVGTVGSIDLDTQTVRIDLTVTHDGARVLGKSQVRVAL